jgi:adenylylsulfate kinase
MLQANSVGHLHAGHHGAIVWFTGLSGAGKSTLSLHVAGELKAHGRRVEVLDGDEVRLNLSKGLGFSREDRDTNIRRIGYVANLLARNGVIAISAAISPYAAVREELRTAYQNFYEVHVHAPLETCIARDPKGLYRKALAGEIGHFTGISDPYEAPTRPDLVVSTHELSIAESCGLILDFLHERRHLARAA